MSRRWEDLPREGEINMALGLLYQELAQAFPDAESHAMDRLQTEVALAVDKFIRRAKESKAGFCEVCHHSWRDHRVVREIYECVHAAPMGTWCGCTHTPPQEGVSDG